MNKNKKNQGIVLFVSIALLLYLSMQVIRSYEDKKIQKITGYIWPKGTKELQRQCAYVQGDWVKVHLQLPDSVQLNTNKFSRFDFSYCGDFDPHKMNIYKWEKQRKVWRFKEGNSWFKDMKNKPIKGTNVFFAASKSFEDVPWVIVYDEQLKQMWIHCF